MLTPVLALSAPVGAHKADETASANGRSDSTVLTMSCPLTVDSDFVDSWGDGRSGGRRHEGVDMAAPRGATVLAVRSGFAEFKVSRSGGNAIWLTTPDGDKFYYAHLDAWEGKSRDVRRGEVIGYVGSTGNARGDHLHFETRPGGTPVNPYSIVSAACTNTRDWWRRSDL
ncbi:MAG TPA: M23 family metallopeptidase [Ilumatobacteraceae bacterium]|nr:M23 family metallopeptidase [Ilumatobacteraceae bacterium]